MLNDRFYCTLNNNWAIHPPSSRGTHHTHLVIGRKLHAPIILSPKFHSTARASLTKFRPEFVTSRTLPYLTSPTITFPATDIDRLSRLRYLDLTANNFSGDIPPAIGRLRELFYLFLVQNEFNGTWPTEIGNLANLEHLAMAYNDKFLPSALPKEFGALKKLKFLWMTEANLIGEIPESFNNLSSLERLDLSLNELNGTIPVGMLTLKNLKNLYLFINRLSGHFPSSIEALNLKEIDLSDNYLTGPIPAGFGKLQNLTCLNLFWNQLSGEIPANISLIPTLETFKQHLCARGTLLGVVASNNNLSGEVPKSLRNCTSLLTIQLSNNRFSGEIPSGIWTSPDMVSVMLAGNSFSGHFQVDWQGICPEWISVTTSFLVQFLLKSLLDEHIVLIATNNNFSGPIPAGISSLVNLVGLYLSNNRFSGPIPAGISSLVNLVELDVSNNMLSGSIPAGISSLLLLSVFKASNNLFSGEIPVELTSLPSIYILWLDGNQLSGQLPHDIVSWKSLFALDLSTNHLSGPIPKAIGSLHSLMFLDLSENQFSGEIPHEFSHFVPNTFNLSSNNLSGEIPPAFEKWEYENSFLNNSNLCANIEILKSCYSKASNSKLSTNYLVMIISFTLTASLVIVFLIFSMVQKYQRWDQGSNVETWKMTSFQKFDFTESNILSSLAQNSLIGSGGSGKVYRTIINHSGEVVAVKWISNNRQLGQNLEKQFVAEVQILGMIRHANIVKLLCCISSESSKILVYEYMENQSLDRWLHGKKRAVSSVDSASDIILDWPMRLQIAIGAARGLCYMHHDFSPPIIHRDVKSSNILLDSEFNTKIADFGLAKMLAKQAEDPETMSWLKANKKIDVYSFGVVLLELATGREANRGNEHMNLGQWAWQHFGEGKSIVEALDEEIMEECFMEEMITVFKLGLMCTSKAPSDRPSMREVLLILDRRGPQQGHAT
ncbi:Receptor-like protein kinase HSL1 [Vitis vinifera]|uniref:non-specific serine/threonine protein kinase n=1 Tax=Vitis vinifera TaxID=29760 RepID=A0A438H3M4_VITVI|nr:Receptor-like protein kinase HSL1 [Vitis vinifera]